MNELLLLGRFLLALVMVIALAVLSLRFLLPRLGGVFGRRRGAEIRLDEVQPIDRQHKVALITVAGRRLLLGLGGGEVTRLASWPEENTAETVAEPAAENVAGTSVTSSSGGASRPASFELFRRRRKREVPPC